MNKNTLILVAVILFLILGGGAFLMSNNRQATTTVPTGSPAVVTTTTVSPVPTTAAAAGSNVINVQVESQGLSFTPNTITVKKGQTVNVVYKNNMGRHDWVLDEFNAKSKLLDAGEEDTITFVADKTGTFEYYCSVPGHRASGMKGSFIVTE
jgi:plastocyanin